MKISVEYGFFQKRLQTWTQIRSQGLEKKSKLDKCRVSILEIDSYLYKLHSQDDVGRWSKTFLFWLMYIAQKMSTQGGRWSNKAKILTMQHVNGSLAVLLHQTQRVLRQCWCILMFKKRLLQKQILQQAIGSESCDSQIL